MKNTFKRTLALALAVVMLLSVSVIGVSAVNEDVSIVKDVMEDTVAVYRFHQERYEGDYMVNTNTKPAEAAVVGSTVAEHYAENEMNWKLYDGAHGYSYFNTRDLLEITVGEGAEYGHSNYHMLVVRAPAAGTYDFTLNYGVTNDSAAAGVKVYMFPESVLTAFTASGTNWKYLVTNNSAGGNGVDLLGGFNCKDATLANDQYRVETFKTTYTFNGEQTYYLVCAATDDNKDTNIGSNKIYLSHLALEKTSADLKEANVKEYNFNKKPDGTKYSGNWYNNSETIYQNYESSGWRYEAASALYQMNNSNTFSSTADSMRFFSSANNWYALRIKAPAAGTYTVKLDYGQTSSKAGVGDVYMFPASVLDATLSLAELDKEQAAVAALLANGKLTGNDLTLTGSAAANKLGQLQGADMFSTIARTSADNTDEKGGNGINNYLETKINAQLTAPTCTTLFTGIQYFASANAAASETSKSNVTIPAAGQPGYSGEYILVFKLTAGQDLYNSKLTFTEVVDSSVAKIGEEKYDSVKAALNAATEADTVTLLADCAVADLGATCNIDLNGHNLTVYGDMTSVGVVSDSKNSTGVLKVTGDMKLLSSEQTQLPLYNEDAAGYGLYAYTWGENNQSEAVKNDDTAKKFWFQFSFTNDEAYELIASGTSGLEIGVVLNYTFDGEPAEKTFVFAEEDGAEAYAAKWARWIISDQPTNPWFFVTVRNAVEGMSVTPYIAVGDTVVSCAAINY